MEGGNFGGQDESIVIEQLRSNHPLSPCAEDYPQFHMDSPKPLRMPGNRVKSEERSDGGNLSSGYDAPRF